MNPEVAYGADTLPQGIRSRFVDSNGLKVHLLEAGFEDGQRPCILLLHGFPELAYSWRKVMLPLANAGYHVIAPDQRGYGLTTGWNGNYDGDLASFRYLNLVRDIIGIVYALGYRSVATVIGHDFGSQVAAWCAQLRPDVFRSLVMMSAPFAGPPELPFNTANVPPAGGPPATLKVLMDLARLPSPRKHYAFFYGSREADQNMREAPQGLHQFLRAFYHVKSADAAHETPYPLAGLTADELSKLPDYYIMDMHKGMAETVAEQMPTMEQVAACTWLSEAELTVYSDAFSRNGFQGALQWYRCVADPRFSAELQIFSGCTIDVPSCFIGGRQDWGVHQIPGAFESMRDKACSNMQAVHLVDHAGHWVQQEQPKETARLLLAFIQQQSNS